MLNLMQSPLLVRRRDGGAPTPALGSPPDWYSAKFDVLRTTPGSQTINLPNASMTPKGVMITMVEATSYGAETAGASFCRGFSNVTDQRSHSVGISSENRRTSATYTIENYAQTVQATVTAFGAGTVTLNVVTNTPAAAYIILVEAFGGPDVTTAYVGSPTGASVYQFPAAANLWIFSGASDLTFPNSGTQSVFQGGFATERDGRVNQVFFEGLMNDTASPRANVNDDACYTNTTYLGGNGSSSIFRSNTSSRWCYLGLVMADTVDLWAGILQPPSSVTTANMMASAYPYLTPEAMLVMGGHSTVEGSTTGAENNSIALGTISGDGQLFTRARRTDNGTGSGGTAGNFVAADNDGITLPDHRGLNVVEGIGTTFGAGEANIYLEQADGAAHLWAGLALGTKTVPTRTDKINSADKHADISLSNGSFVATKITTNAERAARITRGIDAATANHYFEGRVINSEGNNAVVFGLATSGASLTARLGSAAGGYGYDPNGQKRLSGTASAYGATFQTGDTIGIHLNAGSLTFYKNGVSQGVATTGLTGTLYPALSMYRLDAPGPEMAAIALYEDQFKYALPSGASQWGS